MPEHDLTKVGVASSSILPAGRVGKSSLLKDTPYQSKAAGGYQQVNLIENDVSMCVGIAHRKHDLLSGSREFESLFLPASLIHGGDVIVPVKSRELAMIFYVYLKYHQTAVCTQQFHDYHFA